MVLPLLSACAVPIKESTFYTDATPDGAIVSHFFSTETSVIGQAEWDQIREGMTCETAQTFADLKSELEKLCSKTKCTEANVVALRAFLTRMTSR